MYLFDLCSLIVHLVQMFFSLVHPAGLKCSVLADIEMFAVVSFEQDSPLLR